MAKELFNNGKHRCIVFDDIMRRAGSAGEDVQTNQFLITHANAEGDEEGLIFDPGGSKLITHLHKEVTRFISTNRIKKLVLSHQDPDCSAGASTWLMLSGVNAKIYISDLWVRFVPHFSRNDLKNEVYVAIPDEGMRIDLNGADLFIIPAHFLHSPGNFQIFDPVARILFSGDLGTSVAQTGAPFSAVTDFENHVPTMEGFHRRYLASSKACTMWASLARGLDINTIVPQHGPKYFTGKAMVSKFIDWVESIECGADALPHTCYSVPK
jgi:flavorubredoxin